MVGNYKRRNYRPTYKKHLTNQYIKVPEVRLIDSDGQNLGVLSTREALGKAVGQELDLVLISGKANPPVAKILDYSKFLYDERKKHSASKSKSVKSGTKEFIFGPAIGEGDLEQRIARTKEFIKEGNRVKMTVRLRGRQKFHPEIGKGKLEKAISDLQEVAKIEEEPRLRGNLISVIFVKK